MATISLLITYYNEKHLLTECLQSVYNQTVLPDEILVYDDASKFPATDYVPEHPTIKVKVIRGEKNIMLSAARNALMHASQCDYVHYQDADDLLEPFCFEELKRNINANPTDLLVNEVRSIDFDSRQPVSNAVMSLHQSARYPSLVEFGIQGALLAPSVTFKRELGLQLGGYKAGILLQCEDYEFNIRLVHYAKEVQVINRPLIIQRLRRNSMSSDTKELYTEGIKALKLLLAELPERYRTSIAERASRMGRILYQRGYHAEAKQAFGFAKSTDAIPFRNEHFLYKGLCNFLGQYNTEKLSNTYRKMIPKRFREKFSF